MTSQLNVDTIADKAGSGPVGLHKQHAAKSWYVFDGGRTSSTVALEDNFNISSLVDSSGAGNTTLNFANSMNNATYTVVNSTFITSTQSDMSGCVSRTASSHVVQDSHDNGSQTDMERTYGVVFGDLA